MNNYFANLLRVVIGLLLIICCGIAAAANVVVGGQTISIPPPESLLQTTAPRMLQLGELATIKEDRLLAVFVNHSATEQEAKGGLFQVERYALVQATRNVEPYQIPLNTFAKYKSDTKAQVLEGMSADDRVEVDKSMAKISKWFESGMGTKLKISVPQIGGVIMLDETPRSLTVLAKVKSTISTEGEESKKTVEMIYGASQVLVKSKVIWLQLYARSNSRDDFDWVVKNIVKWTRAVTAANR